MAKEYKEMIKTQKNVHIILVAMETEENILPIFGTIFGTIFGKSGAPPPNPWTWKYATKMSTIGQNWTQNNIYWLLWEQKQFYFL